MQKPSSGALHFGCKVLALCHAPGLHSAAVGCGSSCVTAAREAPVSRHHCMHLVCTQSRQQMLVCTHSSQTHQLKQMNSTAVIHDSALREVLDIAAAEACATPNK